MKKILLLADPANLKMQTLDFATYIGRLGKSKIEGLFLENEKLAAVPSIKTFGGQMYVEEVTQAPELRRQNDEQLANSIAIFEDRCTAREVLAYGHSTGHNSLETVVRESRYADLLITDPAVSVDGEHASPTQFVVNLLNQAECPVLISPETFELPEEIIMAFDGSRSSVFAIKQFYYHLPELAMKKITVLHISAEDDDNHEYHQSKPLLDDWLHLHFTDVNHVVIKGDPREDLYKYLLERSDTPNKLLVMGSFGRGHLSSLFRKSTAELVLRAVDMPVFISHD